MNKKNLKIGAGKTYIPGFINVDISPEADICLDLSKDILPFEDNSVDLVFSEHTLEHIPDYLFAISEIHRVLKHEGIFLMAVPYMTSTKNVANPYHLHYFSENSFDFFDPESLKGSAVESNDIFFKKIYHKYFYSKLFKLIPYPINIFFKNYLINVVNEIEFG